MQIERREIVLPRVLYVAAGILAFGYLLYWLREILTPLFLAFTIAYILDPLVDRFERWMPRALGIVIVLLLAVGIVAAFLALAVPRIAVDVASLIQELPAKLLTLWGQIVPWLEARGVEVPHSTTEWIERLGSNASSVASSVLAPAGGILTAVIGWTFSLLGSVAAALVVPVFAVYLLNDFDRMTAGVRDLIPLRFRDTVVSYAREIDDVLSHFMRGQLTVMAILAVLYGGAYAALGVRMAILIGIVAGILNFIPYLGSAFALVAGLAMSLLGGWNLGQLVGVVVAYAAVQTLEGFVITPRVVGKTVGLSEVWVLIALFVGGEIFGFLGVLLAVPVAAVAKIFIARAVQRYRETDLYRLEAEVLAGEAGVALPPTIVTETTPEPPKSSDESER